MSYFEEWALEVVGKERWAWRKLGCKRKTTFSFFPLLSFCVAGIERNSGAVARGLHTWLLNPSIAQGLYAGFEESFIRSSHQIYVRLDHFRCHHYRPYNDPLYY